tara:strand:- start:1420 stop:1542 length:123 start_codon:yes stop_codon:yes gene_type:complete
LGYEPCYIDCGRGKTFTGKNQHIISGYFYEMFALVKAAQE